MADTFQLPGFVDAHCHAFQRGLRGRTEGADFWAWRESMLDLARCQTPGLVRESYAWIYQELRGAGYTAVGEFHYLGLAEAHAAAEAAARRASRSSCSTSPTRAAASTASGRSRSPNTCAASRSCARRASASASPPTRFARAPRLARRARPLRGEHELPLHVHADEQPREIEECLAEHGVRPIELLADCGCLGPRTTVVHATHADGRELDLLAESGSRICACPTTEANLGDGFLPVERVLHRGIGMCIGSDSNARIDPFEELRELDGIARRQAGRRDVLTIDALLCDRIGRGRGVARARRVAGDRDRPVAPSAARPVVDYQYDAREGEPDLGGVLR